MNAEPRRLPSRNVALRREAVAADNGSDPVRAAVLRERLGRALFNQGDIDRRDRGPPRPPSR